MGDDVEDEASMSFDWSASDGQPSGAADTNYYKPSAAWQPVLVAAQQTVPSAPAVESFVNSESMDWNLGSSNAPLNFPLSQIYKPSNPARPQPGPNTGSSPQGGGSQNVPHLVYEEVSQYPSENAAQYPSDGGVSNTAGGAGQAGYMSTGYSTEYSSEPSYQNVPHLVYEEVSQYPSENAAQYPSDGGVSNTAGGAGQAGYMSTGYSTEYSSEPSYQRYPANAGAQQVATSAKGSSPPAKMSFQPKKPVASPKQVFVRVSEPILPPPPPPPSSYIVQSRNNFLRARYLLNKSRYSPGFAPPLAVRSEPARKQPAAPLGVKNHQRYVLHLNVTSL